MKRRGSGVKTTEIADIAEIQYSKKQWKILQEKRDHAIDIMKKLADNNIQALIYGSICRGDVSEQSDIDLFIPFQISSFKLELALEQKNFNIYEKRIVQATPKHLVKAHIYLSELVCITFPLTSIREREFDFIRFGGTLTLDELSENRRVPGVDKRLMLIAPTELGHKESPVMGFESIVAKKVGVNVELVKERVRVLTTRDKVGRTGVYLNVELSPDENIEEIFKQIVDKDPIVRRRTKIKLNR
ncbi:MAG: nucleotidyltransferase domain-containing protein [Candidatus Heimdallarchaeota archaeon]